MYLIIVVCGIAGTLLMTAFVYSIASIKNKKWKVIRLLGTMVCNEILPNGNLSASKKVLFTGTVLHYAIGVLFAFLYHWLWSRNIGEPSLPSALIFGIINGCIGATGWAIYFQLHKNPPTISLKKFLLLIGSSHIFFAIGFVESFRLAMNIYKG